MIRILKYDLLNLQIRSEIINTPSIIEAEDIFTGIKNQTDPLLKNIFRIERVDISEFYKKKNNKRRKVFHKVKIFDITMNDSSQSKKAIESKERNTCN